METNHESWKSTFYAQSDLATIRTLAQVSQDEKDRCAQLKEDLARDPAVGARQFRLRADRLRSFINELDAMEKELSDEALTMAYTFQENAVAARKTAAYTAAQLFADQPLPGVGEASWKSLWESARTYSETRAYPDRAFPPAERGDLCLLCQQPLDDEARRRLQSFENFIQADTETKAEEAERESEQRLAPIRSLHFSKKLQSMALQELVTNDPSVHKMAVRFLASARLRRFVFLRSLEGALNVISLQDKPASELTLLATLLESRASELESLVDPVQRTRWQGELNELEDRQHLETSLSLVEAEFLRLVTIALLEECRKGFATITNLGNKLADNIVTPQLRDRFLDEITSLVSNKVRVEIVRVGGRYGSNK